MSKTCTICGKKLGFLSGPLEFADGPVCPNCFEQVGISGTVKDRNIANTLSSVLIREALASGEKINLELEYSRVLEAQKRFEEHGALKFNLFSFDNIDKKIMFHEKIFNSEQIYFYNYKDILSYSPIERGHSETKKHGISRAVTGGLIAGTTGAIVGAVTGGKNFDYIDKLAVTVHLTKNRSLYISFINVKTQQGLITDSAYDSFYQLLALLDEIILDNNTKLKNNQTVDIEQQLRSLKSLLDDGILTQEEFTIKKQKLLDL